jgi:TAT (twin-arginine translocation) pathway signal sequence
MGFTRRDFLRGAAAVSAAVATTGGSGRAFAAEDAVASGAVAADASRFLPAEQLPMRDAVHSPWMANGIALTRDNTIFLGLPRFPGHEVTPSVARIAADGTAWPFPGGAWNNWQPGSDPMNSFQYVNSVHIFEDDTVWCVDQGALRTDVATPGAQKLVQLHPRTGEVLKVVRYDEKILPPGSKLNDLRLYGPLIYNTDSGLGGIIVHNQVTGKTLRRLSQFPQVLASPEPPRPGSHHVTPKSDLIEISPDGEWLSWASPTGPFRRVRTEYLRDENMPDAVLAAHVETWFDTPLVGGSAMDTLGNIYMSDIHGKRVILRAPSGKETILASDPNLFSGDAPFISADRKLYVPAPQTERTALFGGPDHTLRPFLTFVIDLPKEFAGIPLGDAVTGRPA